MNTYLCVNGPLDGQRVKTDADRFFHAPPPLEPKTAAPTSAPEIYVEDHLRYEYLRTAMNEAYVASYGQFIYAHCGFSYRDLERAFAKSQKR